MKLNLPNDADGNVIPSNVKVMADKTGVARLRQAIENQRDAGEACFTLPIGEATAICDECEDELPRGKDGRPIHVGDTVWDVETGMEFTVKSITLYEGGLAKVDAYTEGCDAYASSTCFSRTRPDSWESLEQDVASYEDGRTACTYYGRTLSECIGCQAIGAKDCDYAVVRDVLLRAEALARRDAKASAPQPSPHGAKEVDRD